MRCTICEELGGDGAAFGQAYEDLVVAERNVVASTASLVVLPSVGPLNDSHVLIVPTCHVHSFAEMPSTIELELAQLKERMNQFTTSVHRWPLVFFEHGAGRGEDSSGACVQHAHIHAIRWVEGLDESLVKLIGLESLPEYSKLFQRADTRNGYACYEDRTGHVWLKNSPRLAPQLFRALYASAQGCPLEWNWRLNYRVNAIEQVLQSYAGLVVDGSPDRHSHGCS